MSEQALALVPASVAGARGRQGRGEASAAGLDQLLAVHRGAETRLERCKVRLVSLRAEEQKAMAAEAQALEEEEGAREELESRVTEGSDGEDLQEAYFRAKETAERVAGELAAWTAQRKLAEEALERAREEVKKAGEDTRPLADKRKCQEQSEEGKRRGQGKA